MMVLREGGPSGTDVTLAWACLARHMSQMQPARSSDLADSTPQEYSHFRESDSRVIPCHPSRAGTQLKLVVASATVWSN